MKAHANVPLFFLYSWQYPATPIPPMTLTTPLAQALPTLARLRDQAARQAATQGAELTAQMLLATIVARYPRPVPWTEIEAETRPVVDAYPSRVIALVNDPKNARTPEPVRVGLLAARRSDGASAIRGELLAAALQGRAFQEGGHHCRQLVRQRHPHHRLVERSRPAGWRPPVRGHARYRRPRARGLERHDRPRR